VDLENRGHRHGLFFCYPLASFLLILSKSRYVPGSVDGIRKSLEWAGLNYDFGWSSPFRCNSRVEQCFLGPGKEGVHGPYFQVSKLIAPARLFLFIPGSPSGWTSTNHTLENSSKYAETRAFLSVP